MNCLQVRKQRGTGVGTGAEPLLTFHASRNRTCFLAGTCVDHVCFVILRTRMISAIFVRCMTLPSIVAGPAKPGQVRKEAALRPRSSGACGGSVMHRSPGLYRVRFAGWVSGVRNLVVCLGCVTWLNSSAVSLICSAGHCTVVSVLPLGCTMCWLADFCWPQDFLTNRIFPGSRRSGISGNGNRVRSTLKRSSRSATFPTF